MQENNDATHPNEPQNEALIGFARLFKELIEQDIADGSPLYKKITELRDVR